MLYFRVSRLTESMHRTTHVKRMLPSTLKPATALRQVIRVMSIAKSLHSNQEPDLRRDSQINKQRSVRAADSSPPFPTAIFGAMSRQHSRTQSEHVNPALYAVRLFHVWVKQHSGKTFMHLQTSFYETSQNCESQEVYLGLIGEKVFREHQSDASWRRHHQPRACRSTGHQHKMPENTLQHAAQRLISGTQYCKRKVWVCAGHVAGASPLHRDLTSQLTRRIGR
jgi:hypothetical protein